MSQAYQGDHHLSISYRNGIYQGNFSKQSQTRQGFGLVYTIDNHTIISSTWHQDEANQATFVYYNHGCYVYGFWNMSIPNGFNAVRMDKIIVMGWYDMGNLVGRVFVMYEQYNLGVLVEKGQDQNQWIEIQKGDVFSDEDFNNFIKLCQWPQFKQEWKTFIKFISATMTSQNPNTPKAQRVKLRLINQSYYRYGYNEGIAVVFDDQYRIISAGLHQKASLKSLGVRFPKENFVEEGNFQQENQVYAFNFGHRPEYKVGKIYSNYLLKSFQFVNKYINNPAKNLVNYLQELVKTNLFRKLLAGQITTRKLQISYGSPQSMKFQNTSNSQANKIQANLNGGTSNTNSKIRKNNIANNSNNELKPDQKPKVDKQTQQDLSKSRKQDLRQQKLRLQTYKKQIYDSINKKSRGIQVDYKQKEDQGNQNQIIHKRPVQLAARSSQKNNDPYKEERLSREKRRSPIFTPDRIEKYQSRSLSPTYISPFKQRMKSRIFEQKYGVPIRHQRYMYQPIEDMYPKHSASISNNQINTKKYNSPHQQLQYSRYNPLDNSQQVVPISVRKQAPNNTQYLQKQRDKVEIIRKQREREFERQRLMQRQRQIEEEILRKQEEKEAERLKEKQRQRQRQKQKERQKQAEKQEKQLKQKSKIQKYNKVYTQIKQKQKLQNQPYKNPIINPNPIILNTANTRYERPRAKRQSQKSGAGTISFRDPYLEKQAEKEVNTSIPNIVITNPNKSKSPAYSQKKITGIQPRHSSPYDKQRDRDKSKEKETQNQKYNTKKNNIYLKQNFKGEDQQQISPNVNANKLKRQIKGSTYLQKYNVNKVSSGQSPTPEKNNTFSNIVNSSNTLKPAEQQVQQKKYNRLIKGFNQNNKIYQKIQSPPKRNITTPVVGVQNEGTKPKAQNTSTNIKQTERPAQVNDFQNTSFNPNNNFIPSSNKDRSNKKKTINQTKSTYNLSHNQTTPSKKKYQYVFQ